MKRILILAAAAVMLFMLSACGNDNNASSSKTGNESAFAMTASQLKSALAGSWVNQNNLDEKLTVNEDFTLEKTAGSEKQSGSVTLNESTGMLNVKIGNDSKSYVWVDSTANLSTNTWYIDGGTFVFGNTTYIKDMG